MPHIPNTLHSCRCVFLRVASHHNPLTSLYTSPHLVIKQSSKAYKINIRGKQERVSTDRLNPAHLDDYPPPPGTITKLGRPMKPPSRPQASISRLPLRPFRGGVLCHFISTTWHIISAHHIATCCISQQQDFWSKETSKLCNMVNPTLKKPAENQSDTCLTPPSSGPIYYYLLYCFFFIYAPYQPDICVLILVDSAE